MIVVADTTPLNYLILLGEVEILPALYDKVLIPQEVHREMSRPGAPDVVKAWASNIPPWCELRTPLSPHDPSLAELDDGERDAIQLALDLGIEMLLMDEMEGRKEALRLNLKVTGTISILEKAGQRGLLDFRSVLERLEKTNFRLSARIRAEFLARNP